MTRRTLFVLALGLAGCMTDSSVPAPSDAPRYLALGDSYTIGEGLPEADRWPVVLAERLCADGVDLAPPEIIAVTGWTTDELAAGIDAANMGGRYELVTLLIGVNDQYRGRPIGAYREALTSLLERAIGFAGGESRRVVVVSFPDWGVTPFAADRDRSRIAREVDAFNATAAEIARQRGVPFVDITPLSRTQGTLTAPDGLHPSADAYRAWVDVIEPAARAALGG